MIREVRVAHCGVKERKDNLGQQRQVVALLEATRKKKVLIAGGNGANAPQGDKAIGDNAPRGGGEWRRILRARWMKMTVLVAGGNGGGRYIWERGPWCCSTVTIVEGDEILMAWRQ